MRSSSVVFLLAAAAGLAAAQNSTSDGGSEPSIGQCVVGCSEQAIVEHSGAAQTCIDAKTDQDRAACICRSDELVGALQSCLTSMCPSVAGQINMDSLLNVEQFNGAAGKSVGILPALAASGAVALGALFL